MRKAVAFVFIALIMGCSSPAVEPQHVLVGAMDHAFDVPDSLPAGEVAFGLENRGKVAHELIVVGLRPEVDVAEILRRDRADSTWRHLREPPSGILTADSGVRTPGSLLVKLERGKRYLLLCNFQDSDSALAHLHLGMFRVVKAH
jgi:hypothetical protein